MLKRLIEAGRAIREYQKALYRGLPLKDGREVRKIGRLLRHDPDKAEELMTGAVPFEPRETYPMRAARWAKAQRGS